MLEQISIYILKLTLAYFLLEKVDNEESPESGFMNALVCYSQQEVLLFPFYNIDICFKLLRNSRSVTKFHSIVLVYILSLLHFGDSQLTSFTIKITYSLNLKMYP
jgi:hypothetical protein